jgi:hypothetical protein
VGATASPSGYDNDDGRRDEYSPIPTAMIHGVNGGKQIDEDASRDADSDDDLAPDGYAEEYSFGH